MSIHRILKTIGANPFIKAIFTFPSRCRAYWFLRSYSDISQYSEDSEKIPTENPLWDYFQNHTTGNGIFKWEHYFDIYHRHFEKFVGKKVNVLEIGIFSGGSLAMWRSYFGSQSHIYGIDINNSCKVYENDYTTIFIGDQADRAFWEKFRKRVEHIDVIIDDGGHRPEQQRITLEELLPYLRPGGVYVCEDIHGRFNRFSTYTSELVDELNFQNFTSHPMLQSSVSQFQSSIHSIHYYPYVIVIEKRKEPITKLSAPRHGTEWQPLNEK